MSISTPSHVSTRSSSNRRYEASVIIPTFNNRRLLQLSLLGFAHQTCPDDAFEIIVVDDGSTDHPAELLDQLNARFGERLRVIRQPNQGRSSARNNGIGHARGDILIFIDADCVPKPEYVAAHLNTHRGHENKVVIGAKYEALTYWTNALPAEVLVTLETLSGHSAVVRENIASARSGNEVAFVSPDAMEKSFAAISPYVLGKLSLNMDAVYEQFSTTLEGFQIPWILFVTQNVSVHRNLIDRAGGFDESYSGWGYEDSDLGFRLHEVGARFEYCDVAATLHQMHPGGNLGSLLQWKECAKNYARFCQKFPCLEVVLHWRYVADLLSFSAYNEVVLDFQRPEVPEALRADYLSLSTQMAKIYCDSDDPRPAETQRRFAPPDLPVFKPVAS